jgi:hypothetical protein
MSRRACHSFCLSVRRTHLASFSSKSASYAPSGPCGVGAVSSRTATGSSPSTCKVRSVAGAVCGVRVGVYTRACTGLRVWTRGEERIDEKGGFALHADVRIWRMRVGKVHFGKQRESGSPDKPPQSAAHPPAASNGARAAAWCFSRPKSANITFDLSCAGAREEGERHSRSVGRGSSMRYCKCISIS